MAALAAQGVTATCSLGRRAALRRHRDRLQPARFPDLPRRPDVNSFAAAVLAAAGPRPAGSWPASWRDRDGAGLGPGRPQPRGRLRRPGRRARAGRPAGADRGRRGPAALAAAVQAVTATWPTRSSRSRPRRRPPSPAARAAATALAARSVALLNRGTPSSLVTPEGTLTIALMRACSAWPCGIWIDGEPRTAPDGSSFAWQHWSHTFEYALAAGPGDWRAAGFPAAGHDYNSPLLAVVTGRHGGPLPARASLAAVEPAGRRAVRAQAARQPARPRRRPAPPGGRGHGPAPATPAAGGPSGPGSPCSPAWPRPAAPASWRTGRRPAPGPRRRRRGGRARRRGRHPDGHPGRAGLAGPLPRGRRRRAAARARPAGLRAVLAARQGTGAWPATCPSPSTCPRPARPSSHPKRVSSC